MSLSKQEQILFINQFKQELISKLINNFKLYRVEPIYVSLFDENIINKRTINFDNCLNNQVYSFVDEMDLILLRYFHFLNIDIYSGIICDYYHFNRDFEISNLNCVYNNILTIEYQIRIEDSLDNNFFENLVKNIFNLINEVVIKINRKLILFTTNITRSSKEFLKKKYPFLPIKKSLNLFLNEHNFLIYFYNKDIFVHRFEVLKQKPIEIKYAQLYLKSEFLNDVLDLGSIYLCPSKDEVNVLTKYNLPMQKNLIILNLNLSVILMHILKLKGLDDLLI